MIKQDIITIVSAETGLSEYDVKTVIDETISTITRALNNYEDVVFRGFGAFKITERSARMGRNINTGQPVHIGARKVVTFEPGRDIKNI